MNRKERKKIDGQKLFSIIASLAIVATLVLGVVSIVKSTTSDKDKNYIDLNVADNETTTAKEKETIKKDAMAETTTPEEKTEPATEVTAQPETDAPAQVNAPVFNFSESSSLLWPVVGDIILGYNMDKTIYFPTLDQYKCNPALVIKADAGTSVLSAAPGVVEDVYVDAATGTTMVISIGNGYKLIYGQLGDLAVGISDNVEAGTPIAKVASPTKYYAKEGSNLYFEMTLEDKPVDPMLYLVED